MVWLRLDQFGSERNRLRSIILDLWFK